MNFQGRRNKPHSTILEPHPLDCSPNLEYMLHSNFPIIDNPAPLQKKYIYIFLGTYLNSIKSKKLKEHRLHIGIATHIRSKDHRNLSSTLIPTTTLLDKFNLCSLPINLNQTKVSAPRDIPNTSTTRVKRNGWG